MAALDLRPLSLGELLDRIFFLYRRHFLVFLGIAVLPYLIFLISLVGYVAFTGLGLAISSSGHRGAPSTGSIIAIFGGGAATVVLFLAAYTISEGATILAVSEIYAGREPSIRKSFALLRGKIMRIWGIALLSLLILIPGFVALAIPGIYLLCRLCVATAPAVLEDNGAAASIRRSFGLTEGFAGRAFMIYLLLIALAVGVAIVFKFPFLILSALSASHPRLLIPLAVLWEAGNLFGNAIVAPVHTIGFALFYYDLRVRKEAFDLQMMMRAIGAAPLFGRDAS